MKNNYLIVIPARAGSKGIKDKNIKRFNGIPLISKTILESKKISKNFDILVSSDGENILSLASENEAIPFKRSSDLALDDSSYEDVLLEVINKFSNIKNYDSIIFLQCTSPLTTHRDIEGAIKVFEDSKSDSIFSCYKGFKPIWSISPDGVKPLNHQKNKRSTRQSVNNQVIENGAIYIFDISIFLKEKTRFCGKNSIYIMPENRSIDIDTETDWIVAEAIERNAK